MGLTPGLNNSYSTPTHHVFRNKLLKHFDNWNYYHSKFPEYSLCFYFVKKRGSDNVRIKGPSISKKMNVVDYSIFLPDEINDLNQYIEFAFEGIGKVLDKYQVPETEILEMKAECKKELGL